MAWLGREGVIYACGEWEHGQLGLPLERAFRDPTSIDPPKTPYQSPVPSTGVRINDKGEELHPIPAIDENEKVSYPVIVPKLRSHHAVTVAAGGDHSMVVTSAGRVFAFGRNDSYQLGVALASDSQFLAGGSRIGVDKVLQEGADERHVGPEPVQVTELRWKSVQEISCGDSHNLARCVDGSVYSWGLGGSGRLGLGHHKSVSQPCKVDLRGRFCVAVAAGYYHSLALLEGGDLVAWGSGDCGQLGTGQVGSKAEPTPVKPLGAGDVCAAIRAGEYHSVALSERGGVYTWGLNASGQLGTGDTARRDAPTKPSELVGVKVSVIACGASFTIAVCESTQVLAWGANDDGCLGMGDNQPRHSPTAIVALHGQVLVQVSCGGRFVGALDDKGKLWVWGSNGHGTLGLGDAKDRYAPVAVAGSEALEIKTVACGYNHMLFASKLDSAEVQSRVFYQQGLVHMDDAVLDGFCLYNWTKSARYYPCSVATNFYDKHGVAMSGDDILCVSVADDARLHELVERLQCIASKGESPLEKCRLLAVAVFYELGGAQRALNTVAERHTAQLVERLQITSRIIPVGKIRIGDSRLRALAFKLVADRLGIPCCLIRGAVPELDCSNGFFDLSVCCPDAQVAAYRLSHHWNLVRLEGGRCYMIDTVGLPSEVREVENSDDLLLQIGQADRYLP